MLTRRRHSGLQIRPGFSDVPLLKQGLAKLDLKARAQMPITLPRNERQGLFEQCHRTIKIVPAARG